MKSSRILRSLASAGAVLALASGCSDNADELCARSTYVHVVGPSVTGEAMLSADTSFDTGFEAVLDELPAGWVDPPVSGPSLSVSIELEYPTAEPEGAEMPPVTVVLDAESNDASYWLGTATFGGPSEAGGSVRGVPPFVVCTSDSAQNCCPHGASSCSGRVTLQLSREADLFPEVRVRYTATPSVTLNRCMEGASAATWTIEEIEP